MTSPTPRRRVLTIGSENIERCIYLVRGQKVMLDADLARLYMVTTGNRNLAVRRNKNRFPADFMFQLTAEEAEPLKLQSAMAKGRGGRRSLPYVFTEQGVAMLSSVLKSELAVQVNIAVMRTFVKLREFAATHSELKPQIDALERKYQQHDITIERIFEAIRELMTPAPVPQHRRIGFVSDVG